MEGFISLTPLPPPHPSGNSSLSSYFPLIILAFKTPLLLGIWRGYGYFLEPHVSGMLFVTNDLPCDRKILNF